MSDVDQWYQNHMPQTTLWSGPDEHAVAFTLVPQWSWFRQLAPQEGPRMLVRYFGNGTAAAGDVWVDALDLGPVGPPDDPDNVPEPEWDGLPVVVEPPAEPAVEPAQWYQNHAPRTTLWSRPDRNAVAFAEAPQWSWFKQLDEQLGPRIFVRYFGNATAAAGDVWVDAVDLGPVEPPPDPDNVVEPDDDPGGDDQTVSPVRPSLPGEAEQWYQSHVRQTALWSGPDERAIAFTLVPQWSWFRQLEPQRGARILVQYFGNRTAQAGAVWVTAADIGPVDPPAEREDVREPDWEPVEAGEPAQWYQSHALRTTLWSGPDEHAVAFAEVPQWSIFRQLAPPEGDRILVQYFGNRTAQAGAVWVTAADIGPVLPPPDPEHVPEPDFPLPAAADAAFLTPQAIAAALGCPLENVETCWPLIRQALRDEGIDDPATLVGAIATVGTEVPAFLPIDEIGSEDYFRRMYGNRRDLGNLSLEDGPRYRGRGFIQLTGRHNYRVYGQSLGIDLEANPELAGTPEVAARVLARYFKERRIHEAAPASNWEAVRERVNGGSVRAGTTNGWGRFIGFVKELERRISDQIVPSIRDVPLVPAAPWNFSIIDGCARYAQTRRPSLGPTGGRGGAADYITKFADRIVRVSRHDGDLRLKIGRGFAVVWNRGHRMLSEVGRIWGHVAIVEEVADDHVVVSQAGATARTDLTTYPTFSMRMRINRQDLEDLYLIR